MIFKEKVSYDPSTGLFSCIVDAHKNKAGDIAGLITEYGYVVINVCGKRYRAHRIAWYLFYGWWPPKGFDIDHKNRIKTDNRICNLRLASRMQNSWNCNSHKHNTSGFRGVSWHSKYNKWVARLHINRKCVFYKMFDSFDDACSAIESQRNKIYGQFSGANK